MELVHLLDEVGADGVNFDDNDLVTIGATSTERDRIIRKGRASTRMWPTSIGPGSIATKAP